MAGTTRTGFLIAALILSLPSVAHAACSGPAGMKGEIIYNDDFDVLQFCDDTNWVGMSGGSSGGGAGVTDGDKGDISVSGSGASWLIDDDLLDFTEFSDTLTLDATTSIAITGSNVLSLINSGTGNSFVVEDQASDTSPFVIAADGKVGIGLAVPTQALDVVGTVTPNSVLMKKVGGLPAPTGGSGSSGIQVKTTAERDAISSPATGMVIYNTTTAQLEVYSGSAWVGVGASGAASAKAITFGYRSGAIQILQNTGVASVTRTSAGVYEVNWTTAFPNDKYVVIGSCNALNNFGATFVMEGGSSGDAASVGVYTTKATVGCRQNSTNTSADDATVSVAAFETSALGGGGGGSGVTDGDKGDITVSGTGASWMLDDDVLNFSELSDTLTLDASTDIAASGTNALSITNSGTGNSLLVNDAASDTTPFVIDAAGNVGIGTTTPSTALEVVGTIKGANTAQAWFATSTAGTTATGWTTVPGLSTTFTLLQAARVSMIVDGNFRTGTSTTDCQMGTRFNVDGTGRGEGTWGEKIVRAYSPETHHSSLGIMRVVDLAAGSHTISYQTNITTGPNTCYACAEGDGTPLSYTTCVLQVQAFYQ